jgi:sugar/nucleoside kinase (ribokinase family)
MSVAAAGNWIIDHIKVVDCYPDQDALANILSESSGGGGAPYNLLKTLAKTGYCDGLAAIGMIGRDPDGDRILRDCQSWGIDTSGLVQTDEASTSYTDVMSVQSSGRRTFFHHRGANKLLSPEYFDFDRIGVRHLHLGYLLLLDGLDSPDSEYGTGAARVLARAKEHGLTTSIDVVSEDSDRFREIVLPAAKLADIVFMNEFELARTTGIAFEPEDVDTLKRAGALLAEGLSGRLVIHTPDRVFAFLANGDQIHHGTVCMPEELIRGTVGAGDAFAAGYLAGFMDGQDVLACLRSGCGVAASSLTAPDSTSGVLPWEQCMELGDRYGFRGTSQPTI